MGTYETLHLLLAFVGSYLVIACFTVREGKKNLPGIKNCVCGDSIR